MSKVIVGSAGVFVFALGALLGFFLSEKHFASHEIVIEDDVRKITSHNKEWSCMVRDQDSSVRVEVHAYNSAFSFLGSRDGDANATYVAPNGKAVVLDRYGELVSE